MLTWFITGGPITKTIKYLGLTKHYILTLERMWQVVNSCEYMGVQYTVENITKHVGRPYVFKNMDEINILTNAMENCLGLCYTTHLINFHRYQEIFNAMCKFAVNIRFLRLQHKIIKY